MAEKFYVNGPDEFDDRIYNEIYECAFEAVTTFYSIDDLSELTEEQLVEVEEYTNSMSESSFMATGLRYVIYDARKEDEMDC
jgi:hypothetical protein